MRERERERGGDGERGLGRERWGRREQWWRGRCRIREVARKGDERERYRIGDFSEGNKCFYQLCKNK